MSSYTSVLNKKTLQREITFINLQKMGIDPILSLKVIIYR